MHIKERYFSQGGGAPSRGAANRPPAPLIGRRQRPRLQAQAPAPPGDRAVCLFLRVPTDGLWADDFLGHVQGQGMCRVSLGDSGRPTGPGCQVPGIRAHRPRLLAPAPTTSSPHSGLRVASSSIPARTPRVDILTPVLQTGKLRPRGVKRHAHTQKISRVPSVGGRI